MKQDHAGRSGQGLPYSTRLSMILFFLKGSGRYFFAAVFSAALMALLDLVNPRIVGYTVDSVIGDSTAEIILPLRLLIHALGGSVYLKSHLWMVSLTIIGIAVAAALFRYGFRRLNTTGAETLVRTMRDALYDRITVLPLSWYNGHRTGDLIQRCTADVEIEVQYDRKDAEGEQTSYIGGLQGGSTYIKNSTAKGRISISGDNGKGQVVAGGLAGSERYGIVSGNSALTSIQADGIPGLQSGSLIGEYNFQYAVFGMMQGVTQTVLKDNRVQDASLPVCGSGEVPFFEYNGMKMTYTVENCLPASK